MFKFLNIFLLLSLCFLSSFANASSEFYGGRIHFTGSIVNDPCMVETEGNMLTTFCPNSKGGKLEKKEVSINQATTMTSELYNVKEEKLSDTAAVLVISYK